MGLSVTETTSPSTSQNTYIRHIIHDLIFIYIPLKKIVIYRVNGEATLHIDLKNLILINSFYVVSISRLLVLFYYE